MSFVETRFPADISYGSSGGPAYSTDVVTTAGGHEQRNINWNHALARYNVAHGVKTQTQLETLIAFFRARKGRAHGFRFKDWTDYAAQGQRLGVGDGEAASFQLVKRYISEDGEEMRLISKPVEGTVQVYVNGTLQVAGMTVNHAAGVVEFDAAPAAGAQISADFEFDVPVRFDTDSLSARLDDYGVYSWADIPLVELRMGGWEGGGQ